MCRDDRRRENVFTTGKGEKVCWICPYIYTIPVYRAVFLVYLLLFELDSTRAESPNFIEKTAQAS